MTLNHHHHHHQYPQHHNHHRSARSSSSEYNPQAAPFYPSSLYDATKYGPQPHLQPSLSTNTCRFRVNNLADTNQDTFTSLLDSIIETLDAMDLDYEVVEYNGTDPTSAIVASAAASKSDDSTASRNAASGNNNAIKDTDSIGPVVLKVFIGSAVVATNWLLAYKLLEALHGYEWHGRSLDAKILHYPFQQPMGLSIPPQAPLQPRFLPQLVPPIYGYAAPYSAMGFQPPDQWSAGPELPHATRFPRMAPSTWGKQPVKHRSSSLSSSSASGSSIGLPPLVKQTAASLEKSLDDGLPVPLHLHQQQQPLTIVNEDGQTIKVNPRRLFVGNVPFTSSWLSLKHFLVTKAEEIEPNNNIEIVRVEIPIQTSHYNENRMEEYPRGTLRGFAIVTTEDLELSQKLMKYFDDVEFEGRKLTVRFDKFPDYNNYMVQSTYKAAAVAAASGGNPYAIYGKPLLSNLAFERNLFQQNYYYGGGASTQYMPQVPYGQGYFYSGPSPSVSTPGFGYAPQLTITSPTITSPTIIPPRAAKVVERTGKLIVPSGSQHVAWKEGNVDEDDLKARELVNSFQSMGLSS